MVSLNERINELYFNPEFPASFSSLNKFYTEAKKVIKTLKRSDLKRWAQQSPTYTIHKSARKKFTRERILTMYIDYLWEIDLVDVTRIKEFNDGYTFLLVCIDTFSKYVWIHPLKRKTGKETNDAFISILEESGRKPKKVRYDQGTEFKNKHFQKLLKDEGINGYEAINDTKAAIVERFNRTLKNKMYRYFTAANTFRYVDVLQDLVKSYNNTYHRSIGMKPVNVTESNSKQVRMRLFPSINKRVKQKTVFKVGDYVRISRKKRIFQKEHAPTWTEEIFKVKVVDRKTRPITYTIEDLLDEEIKGKFYKEQLQKVDLPVTFIIEKIHKRRTRRGVKEVLVSWRGYPSKFMQWIPAEDIQDIQ